MYKLYFLLTLALFSYTTNAQLTNGLVAHWEFNGNTNDASGNGNHGTGTNITYTSGKQGVNNTAVRLAGSNSYISVPYKSNLNVTQFSICAMVKVNDYYTGPCEANAILWRGSQWQNGYYSLIYFENPYNSCHTLDTSKEVFAGQIANLIATPSAAQWQYSPNIVSQRWYCVITTFNGTQSKIYVDGILKSTYTVSAGSIGSSTEGLAIGANIFSGSTYPYWMNGDIDDLRIYDRVLSNSEISQFCGLFTQAPPKVSITTPNIKSSFCLGESFTLHYTVTSAFSSGNTFTAQLSDASGNFTNPLNIGSVNATGAGTITCTIPTSIVPGNGYRVRIVASTPPDTSADNGFNLTIHASPTITTNTNSPVCIGDTLWLNATVTPSTTAISWTGPNGFTDTVKNIVFPSATGSHSGRYIVTASNSNCTNTDTIEVSVGSLNIDLGSDTVLCNGKSFTITPGIGDTYLWQDGSTDNQYTVSSGGLYYVTVTKGKCISADSINIRQVSIDYKLPNDTVLCPDLPFTLSVPDTFDAYKWSDGSTGTSIKISTGKAYWLELKEDKCTSLDSIIITELPDKIALGNDTTLCNEDALILNLPAGHWEYTMWSNGETKNLIEVKEQGIYSVEASNICGTFKDTIAVMFEDCLCNATIPDAFTPNNDGLNDVIKPMIFCQPTSYKFMIANRWGQIVFVSTIPGENWDGNFKGKAADVGTYYYLYQAIDVKGRKYLQKGDILLLR